MFAIKNGRILTMADQGSIDPGTIVIENGKIEEVGSDISIPAQASVINVDGNIVVPGLIDSHNHIGGHAEAVDPPFDNNENTSPITPQVRMIDGVNPLDRGFDTALEAGVTAIFCTPGSANVVSGTPAVLKTKGTTIDDMIVRNPAAMKMAFGRKNQYDSTDLPYPKTRMGTAYTLRKALVDTQNYIEKKQAAKEDPEEEPPKPDLGLEKLAMMLRKEIPAHVHMKRSDDLMTFARIAREFDFNWCIAHGYELHKVADQLANDDHFLGVSLGPFIRSDSSPDIDWTTKAAAILDKAGINVSLQTDGPAVFPTHHITLIAAAAARGGLNKREALKAITINAAKLIGVDDQLGSIEPGKDADIVVYSGHPFKWRSKVKRVFLNGKEVVSNE